MSRKLPSRQGAQDLVKAYLEELDAHKKNADQMREGMVEQVVTAHPNADQSQWPALLQQDSRDVHHIEDLKQHWNQISERQDLELESITEDLRQFEKDARLLQEQIDSSQGVKAADEMTQKQLDMLKSFFATRPNLAKLLYTDKDLAVDLVRKTKEDASKLDMNIADLRGELSLVRQQIEDIGQNPKEQMATSLQPLLEREARAFEQLEQARESAQTVQLGLERRLSVLQDALDDQVAQYITLEGESATLQETLERVETDIQRLRNEASTRSINYAKEASDHQETRNRLSQLQEGFDSLTETCDARRAEVSTLERQSGQLRTALRVEKDEVRRLESEAGDYKQVIANLETKVSGLERQKDQLGLDLRSQREEVRRLESEAEGYKKVIANLETKVSGLERQKDQLGLDLQSERDKVQRLESEASDSKKLIASGAAEVSHLQSLINQLNIDLRSERDEVRRLESVVVDEDETVRELQRKLEAQVQETVKVQKTADSQNTEIERLNAAAAQQQKDAQDAITASNVKYEAQTQYLANVQKTAERQAAEIERLNAAAAQQQKDAQDAIRISDAKYEAQAQHSANVQKTADKQAAEIERLITVAVQQQETAQDTLKFVENERNTLKSTTAQQEKNIEDLRHAKEGAEAHSLSISKFFLSYIKAVQGIENLDLSVVDQMMAFSDSTPSSASAPALEVGRVGPRMIMCGRLSRHLSEPHFATAYSLWLSAMSGSTDLYGVDNFFGQHNVTSDQSLVSWVVGAVAQTIRNLSSQNTLTPKFVKTILLMLQGIAYVHIIGKVLQSQESPSELLELLAVWLDEQPAQIPVNSILKEALTAVQQLIQRDVPISSWISLVNIDAARIIDATNSDLPTGSFLIADDIRGFFIFHQATGEIVIFENDDFLFHIGGVDGIGIDVVFTDGMPTLNLAVPDGGNTGAPLRWMVGYVDESLLR